MSDRVRSAVLGLGIGVAPLLLLDLARILSEAVAADGGQTSPWWPIAGYLGAGAVAAVGVAAGRRDRLVPVVAAVVLLIVVLPTVPLDGPSWLPRLPLMPADAVSQAVVFAVCGVLLTAAVRGPKR